jgi:hypothetical protein
VAAAGDSTTCKPRIHHDAAVRALILIVALFPNILAVACGGTCGSKGLHDDVRENEQGMRNGLTVLAVVSALFCAPAIAQDEQATMSARLQADAMGTIRTGAYVAGDTQKFTLDRYGNKFLLRVDGDPEVYVLYEGHASLGGRVLKFDTGAIAVSVAGWGGMTLYTDAKPAGLPADWTGDSSPPSMTPVSQNDMQSATGDESQHLDYATHLKMKIEADWASLATNARERAIAFDVLQNCIRGIDRFGKDAKARAALNARIDSLQLALSSRPTAAIRGKTLVVSYNKNQDYAGRASSRAIARALGLLLNVKTPN